jgi:hypothetical protein
MRYGMPRAGDLPYFATDINEVASTTHPLGFHVAARGESA